MSGEPTCGLGDRHSESPRVGLQRRHPVELHHLAQLRVDLGGDQLAVQDPEALCLQDPKSLVHIAAHENEFGFRPFDEGILPPSADLDVPVEHGPDCTCRELGPH